MATKIYDSKNITLLDGTEIRLTPLKIKYLRDFMDYFDQLDSVKEEIDAINLLSKCAQVAMRQYHPSVTKTEDVEDLLDLPTIYKILDVAAGIKVNSENEEPVKQQAQKSGEGWKGLDLASLESEVFLLGIWKDYEELEASLSMPELLSTLNSKRELDYQEKKFLAAMQGVDLDKQSKKNDEWEQMKARVFSGNATSDPNDVLSLQGQNAEKAGFGIGMGLGYKKI
jgi:hypothetical protein